MPVVNTVGCRVPVYEGTSKSNIRGFFHVRQAAELLQHNKHHLFYYNFMLQRVYIHGTSHC